MEVVAFQWMVVAEAVRAWAATVVAVQMMGMVMLMAVERAVEVALVQVLMAAVVVPLMVAESFDYDRVRVHDPFALASSKELARLRTADADDQHAIVDFAQQVNVLQQTHDVHPLSPS